MALDTTTLQKFVLGVHIIFQLAVAICSVIGDDFSAVYMGCLTKKLPRDRKVATALANINLTMLR